MRLDQEAARITGQETGMDGGHMANDPQGRRQYILSLFLSEFQALCRIPRPWVKDPNAAFDFCDVEYYLALKDGKVAGRVAAIINRLNNIFSV